MHKKSHLKANSKFCTWKVCHRIKNNFLLLIRYKYYHSITLSLLLLLIIENVENIIKEVKLKYLTLTSLSL